MHRCNRKFGRASRKSATAALALYALIALAYFILQTTQPALAFGPTCTVASSGADYATIQAAASDLNCSTISVAAGTYTEHVTITRTLTLIGSGAGSTIADGTNTGTVFSITANSAVTLNALTITNGKAADGSAGASGGDGSSGSNGGGIVNAGSLTLTNSTLSGNTAGNGGAGSNGVGAGASGGNGGAGGNAGGILNLGTLSVISSTLTSNQAGTGGAGGDGFGSSVFVLTSKGGDGGSGGGIFNSGTLSVTSSILGGNNAGNGGPGGNGVDNNNTASAGGDGGKGGNGGGISSSGSLSVSSNSTLSDNSAGSGGNGGDADQFSFNNGNGGKGGNAGSGGAISNDGTASATNITISGNTSGNGGSGGFGSFGGPGQSGFPGNGGGIANNLSLNVTASIFSTNSASNVGGGIVNLNGSALNVSNSSFFTNTASSAGGGIYLDNPGSLTLSNSTLSSNSSPNGGAIYTVGFLTVVNSTLAGNSQGILNQFAQPFTLRNSIVANNPGGNCSGFITDGGGNLQFNPNSGCGAAAVGDPKLGSPANNGGPTQTMALGAGSAAIDLANPNTCAASIGSPNFGAGSLDQRGLPRRVNGSPQLCDAGAFEAQPASIAIVAGTPQSAVITTMFALPLQAQVQDAFNNFLGGTVVAFAGPVTGASIIPGSSTTTGISGTVSFGAIANGTAGGPYNVTANPAGVSPVNFALTNLKAATLTALASAPNPSLLGQTVNITATVQVAPPITGAPTGSVTFYEVTTLNPSVKNPRAPQSVITLVNGQAVFTTTALAQGTHTVKADYSGDVNLYPSTAPALTQVVNSTLFRYFFPLWYR